MTQATELPDHGENRRQKDFVKRLREALKKGGGYTHVLEKSGISNASLNRYLKGGEMKASIALRVAEVCGVSPGWLLFGEEAGADCGSGMLPMSSLNVQMIRSYPEIATNAGLGSTNSGETQYEKLAVAREILEELRVPAEDAIMIRVAGDSMSPTLMHHDRVLIDTRHADYLSGIYLFTLDGQSMVRRLSIAPGGYVDLIPDNERYLSSRIQKSKICWKMHDSKENSDGLIIIGRVVFKMQKMS